MITITIPCECDSREHLEQMSSSFQSRSRRGHPPGECERPALWTLGNGKNVCLDCKGDVYFSEMIVGLAKAKEVAQA